MASAWLLSQHTCRKQARAQSKNQTDSFKIACMLCWTAVTTCPTRSRLLLFGLGHFLQNLFEGILEDLWANLYMTHQGGFCQICFASLPRERWASAAKKLCWDGVLGWSSQLRRIEPQNDWRAALVPKFGTGTPKLGARVAKPMLIPGIWLRLKIIEPKIDGCN